MHDDFEQFIIFINELSAPVAASISSGVLALLRIAYAKEEKRWFRRFLEGTICSMLTFSCAYLAISIGISENVSYAIGAYIGWYGADETARIAKAKVRKLIDEEKSDGL